jgi:hypothetical protein
MIDRPRFKPKFDTSVNTNRIRFFAQREAGVRGYDRLLADAQAALAKRPPLPAPKEPGR